MVAVPVFANLFQLRLEILDVLPQIVDDFGQFSDFFPQGMDDSFQAFLVLFVKLLGNLLRVFADLVGFLVQTGAFQVLCGGVKVVNSALDILFGMMIPVLLMMAPHLALVLVHHLPEVTLHPFGFLSPASADELFDLFANLLDAGFERSGAPTLPCFFGRMLSLSFAFGFMVLAVGVRHGDDEAGSDGQGEEGMSETTEKGGRWCHEGFEFSRWFRL